MRGLHKIVGIILLIIPLYLYSQSATIEPYRKTPGYTITGELRDFNYIGVNGGYVFALANDGKTVLGYSQTIYAPSFKYYGYWRIEGLEANQDIILFGFHPDTRCCCWAVERVHLGEEDLDVGVMELECVEHTGSPEELVGIWNILSLANWVVGEFGVSQLERKFGELADRLMRYVNESSSSNLNRGLVAYWSFDDGTARDNSGNGHNGIIHGNPKVVNGVKGRAFQFGKVDNYIYLDKSELTDLATNNFTVIVWVKLNKPYCPEGNSKHGIIIRKMPGGSACGGGYSYDIVYDETTGEHSVGLAIPVCNPYSYNQKYINLGNLEIGKWYMIASVYLAGWKVKTYLNGKLVGELDYSGIIGTPNTTVNFQIGQKPDDSYYRDLFPGIIDELRIYKRALKDVEIKKLYLLYTKYF